MTFLPEMSDKPLRGYGHYPWQGTSTPIYLADEPKFAPILLKEKTLFNEGGFY